MSHLSPQNRGSAAASVEIDAAALRAQFPTLADTAYLNSGSYGLLAAPVKAAFESYLSDRLRNGSNWPEWVARAERARHAVGAILGATPEEIALTTSASAGINAIASALDFSHPRNRILVSDFEFPTSGHIWNAQARRGAIVEYVPEVDGKIPVESFERMIDERTKLVAVSHVCYRNGVKLDIAPIVRAAHARGAYVLLDCFQSAGVCALDVHALGVDFAVGGMLKYLLGTAGIGFLYVKRELAVELEATDSGWFAQEDPNTMDLFHHVPARDARRFQAGTPPVAACFAAEAGLGIITELGPPAIERRVRELTGHCMDRLLAEGWSLATPRADHARGPMVAIRSTNEHELVRRLAERRVVTSCRDGNVRAMFHAYNDEGDVDALVDGLRAHSELVRRRAAG